MVRRILLVLLVALPFPLLGAQPASAGCRFSAERLAGADRIDTAIAISKRGHPAAGSAASAVLARSDAFADALAGAPFAVRHGAPLLLTASGALDTRVRDELRRAVPSGATVYLLGGTGALSAAVESSVRAAGFVPQRMAGDDRYETAVEIANDSGSSTVFLATGRNFPDGVVAGASATKAGAVVLFTDDRTIPAATAGYLLRATKVYAFGDQAASAAPTATRISGATRFETSVAAARTFFPGSREPLQWSLATGADFPDALAGGALVTQPGGGPLLLTTRDEMPKAVDDWVAGSSANADDIFILGDKGVVGKQNEDRIYYHAVAACGP
jgi:putative cell wall-binding protein